MLFFSPRLFVGGALFVCFLVSSVSAHVGLDSPNGGESYGPGQAVTVTWTVTAGHNTIAWHLEYQVDGGAWIPIEQNLAPGDINTGAIHHYTWVTPFISSDSVRVRIIQDNTGTDWDDVSSADFSIGSEFFADAYQVSVSTGGIVAMTVDAGPSLGGLNFIVAGSVSGSTPGIGFQGFVVPLNPDFYFTQTVSAPNQAPFTNSLGVLDANGAAQAIFTLPANALPASAAGIVLTHAAAVFDATDAFQLVTPPAPLTLAL